MDQIWDSLHAKKVLYCFLAAVLPISKNGEDTFRAPILSSSSLINTVALHAKGGGHGNRTTWEGEMQVVFIYIPVSCLVSNESHWTHTSYFADVSLRKAGRQARPQKR